MDDQLKQEQSVPVQDAADSTATPAATPSVAEHPHKGMEDMLDDKASGMQTLHGGSMVEGVVMRVDKDGVLMDVGSKSEGFVPMSEMRTLTPDALSHLKVGDKVFAQVLGGENEEGQIVLSIDRARGLRAWAVLEQQLQKGEMFEADVLGFNKGGLLVDVEGIRGFVPLSQVSSIRSRTEADGEGLATLVGKRLKLKVVEIDQKRNRVILSERAAMQQWRSQQKDVLLGELREGQVRKGRVTGIRDFGVFVDLGGADGLIHRSELAWEQDKSPEESLAVGAEVEVYVMRVDPETKRIALSLRRAQTESWEEIAAKYKIGELIQGKVTKLTTFGAFVRIEGPVEGLVHISELADRRVQHPKEIVTEGDVRTFKIVKIEPERHRLGLSLKQAEVEK
ncbi:MAG: S1 RNA-binding domain-containing protein [Dehalococcoidia bacterium]|nr:S1 RNA-binding domain-containing protein [Dehalococcoidia bacterium]